ncbi:MAG: GNAT family N-acetyltransferase [Oscillospiraceae bacterium]|nr:GNAT family N-acetyltransferase [Oscillospiraceae bacterium]
MRYAPFRPLETARLRLRKLETGDVPLYFARLGSSQRVTEHMLWVPHKDISESEASIRKALSRYETGKFYRWAITTREENAIIGIIDLLRFDEDRGTCSFAYMLGEDFWGRGYGTEAVKAVLAFAFSEMELEAVEADHFAENPASGAVMCKAGMTCQGVAPGAYEKNGVQHDAPQYRITREEWHRQNGQR